MRVLKLLLALISVAAGVALGALNPQPVTVDLGFHVVHSTLGVVVLAALLLGAITGGVVLLATGLAASGTSARRAKAAGPGPSGAD